MSLFRTSEMNQIPRSARSGDRSHARSSPPRAGYTAASVRSWRAMSRRRRSSSGSTSSRPTTAGDQPNLAVATLGPRRSFTSRTRFVSSSEPRSDLTSMTATARRVRRTARMSIDPRSPNSANDTSTAVVQPRRSRAMTARSTSAAWRSSSRRSAAAPFHHTPNRPRAPAASKIRRRRSSRTDPAAPASTRITSRRGTPARTAIAACVVRVLRLRRTRRRAARSSSGFAITRASSLPLIARSTRGVVDCAPHGDDREE